MVFHGIEVKRALILKNDLNVGSNTHAVKVIGEWRAILSVGIFKTCAVGE